MTQADAHGGTAQAEPRRTRCIAHRQAVGVCLFVRWGRWPPRLAEVQAHAPRRGTMCMCGSKIALASERAGWGEGHGDSGGHGMPTPKGRGLAPVGLVATGRRSWLSLASWARAGRPDSGAGQGQSDRLPPRPTTSGRGQCDARISVTLKAPSTGAGASANRFRAVRTRQDGYPAGSFVAKGTGSPSAPDPLPLKRFFARVTERRQAPRMAQRKERERCDPSKTPPPTQRNIPNSQSGAQGGRTHATG